ncbi:carbohydrate sulfotransferase 11-like [Acanthaster planci]|uniref:Carbohydrate sulfotransferase n=1 Tax=Acanthaster planci TaxID=133434 RepID=A0A8B8A2A5_ACAPL|nr:carbohydrate sulfotransferase 11-like [Acanthaster planci]
MSARRIVRATKKRIILAFLILIAVLYTGFVVFGQGFVVSKTDTLLKKVFSKDAVSSGHEVVGPLDTRQPVLGSNTSSDNNASQSFNATLSDDRATIQGMPEMKQEDEAEFLQRMANVQNVRHDLIRRRCADTYNITEQVDFRRDREKILSWKKFYEHAYANDDFKFIICRVLKVGSFSWRKVIRSLYDKGSPAFKKKQKMGDYPIREYDNETFLVELENYTKILFVREPFARLLSAYRDKYVELRHFPYYKPIGSKIIQAFRQGATRRQINSGKPTFEEFVKWLVRDPDNREGDYHWRPLFDWYHPCEMHYDYIGKLETATEDARYIFKMLGIDKLETYPSTETHHKFSSTKDVLKQYYSQISPELVPKIVYRYREEFVLFNYSVPQTLSDIWS